MEFVIHISLEKAIVIFKPFFSTWLLCFVKAKDGSASRERERERDT